MLTPADAERLLADAELVCSAEKSALTIRRMAAEITARLATRNPLVLLVMNGALMFAGDLLRQLAFPLEVDYLQVSRYRDATRGGELNWLVEPRGAVAGRAVLVLDDILDEGVTLAAIRERLLAQGAAEVLLAVFADKALDREKPVHADFVGIVVPNRYVFGYGMDIRGAWRHLPAVYALKET
jgi:hypoxanthine phosphoribosyltransferase